MAVDDPQPAMPNLEAAIGKLLGNDPVCGGRVTGDTIRMIAGLWAPAMVSEAMKERVAAALAAHEGYFLRDGHTMREEADAGSELAERCIETAEIAIQALLARTPAQPAMVSKAMIEAGLNTLPIATRRRISASKMAAIYLAMTKARENGECAHDWHYSGTDRGGSHKGEDAYKCYKCGAREYQP